jgi:hypothetical protein
MIAFGFIPPLCVLMGAEPSMPLLSHPILREVTIYSLITRFRQIATIIYDWNINDAIAC